MSLKQAAIDNDHQKTVSGKNQHGPEDKVGRDAGGNKGSKGQNVREESETETASVGSRKPEGDGPGTKKFKHEHDDARKARK